VNILIDSKCYSQEYFGSSFSFMLAHGLIQVKEYLSSYKVVFVGEVITPYGYFISLPKNFSDTNSSNVDMVKLILKEIKNLKRNGKILLKNKTYGIGNEIDSDFYYWRKLYSYFIDYITYEFYYPKKRIIKHSIKKQHGRLNPMLTEINRERMGNGMTFEIKDYSDNDFRNVFYTTLKHLEKEYASETESNKIIQVEKYLKDKQISFEEKDSIDVISFLKYAKKLQTNPIHDAILKTLVNYYQNSKIKEKNTINVFYTKEFEYVYEYLLQLVLNHNKSYRNINWSNPNFKSLQPDIIAELFIGDAKYYKIDDYLSKSFEKELYAYNVANGNSQPNFVFIPSEETRHLRRLTHNSYQLEVVTVDLKAVLKDRYRKQKETLNFVETLISNKGY
jgi:hypothetical protein